MGKVCMAIYRIGTSSNFLNMFSNWSNIYQSSAFSGQTHFSSLASSIPLVSSLFMPFATIEKIITRRITRDMQTCTYPLNIRHSRPSSAASMPSMIQT